MLKICKVSSRIKTDKICQINRDNNDNHSRHPIRIKARIERIIRAITLGIIEESPIGVTDTIITHSSIRTIGIETTGIIGSRITIIETGDTVSRVTVEVEVEAEATQTGNEIVSSATATATSMAIATIATRHKLRNPKYRPR